MVDKAYEVLDPAEATERWRVNEAVNTALILGEAGRALDYIEAAATDDPRRLMHVGGGVGPRQMLEFDQ